MSDAAQGEPRDHEVFRTPLPVRPKYEFWFTPGNYYGSSLGGKVPPKIKVWRVQNSGRAAGRPSGGVVSRVYGFEDSPDAEILTAGFNVNKESGAVGVGRHGNFLQWGFSAPPSKMTDAGKAFFVNCIVYIRKFDGTVPLVRTRDSHRLYAWRDARFRKHIELVHRRNGKWQVDEDLLKLGLGSNRKISTLAKLIDLLSDKQHAQAATKLLQRYTEMPCTTHDQWRQWLAANRGRIYFSDRGGYKFRVIPKGYKVSPHWTKRASQENAADELQPIAK